MSTFWAWGPLGPKLCWVPQPKSWICPCLGIYKCWMFRNSNPSFVLALRGTALFSPFTLALSGTERLVCHRNISNLSQIVRDEFQFVSFVNRPFWGEGNTNWTLRVKGGGISLEWNGRPTVMGDGTMHGKPRLWDRSQQVVQNPAIVLVRNAAIALLRTNLTLLKNKAQSTPRGDTRKDSSFLNLLWELYFVSKRSCLRVTSVVLKPVRRERSVCSQTFVRSCPS